MADKKDVVEDYLDSVQRTTPVLASPEARAALRELHDRVAIVNTSIGGDAMARNIFYAVRKICVDDLALLKEGGLTEEAVAAFVSNPAVTLHAFLAATYETVLREVAKQGGIAVEEAAPLPVQEHDELSPEDELLLRMSFRGQA